MLIRSVVMLHPGPSRSHRHLHDKEAAANDTAHSFAIWIVSTNIVDAGLNF